MGALRWGGTEALSLPIRAANDGAVLDLDSGDTSIVLPQSLFISTGLTFASSGRERGDFPFVSSVRDAGEFAPLVFGEAPARPVEREAPLGPLAESGAEECWPLPFVNCTAESFIRVR